MPLNWGRVHEKCQFAAGFPLNEAVWVLKKCSVCIFSINEKNLNCSHNACLFFEQ